MVLVDYPDSSSESEDQGTTKEPIKQRCGKRKAERMEPEGPESSGRKPPPPPLPSSFHSLYATNVRSSTTDDPSLHAGRTRQVPHAVGNWPTHVYLEWYPSKCDLVSLDTVVQKAGLALGGTNEGSKIDVHSFLHSDLGAPLPLHISLSAPLVLRTEQKKQFHARLESRLREGRIQPFRVKVSGLDWVPNHDKTRFFLVLKLMKPENDELNRLLSICNAVTRQFNLPQLYEGPYDTRKAPKSLQASKTTRKVTDKSDAFHVSIAWTLDEPHDRARQELIRLVDDKLRALEVSFPLLKLKIGNSVIDSPFTAGCGGTMNDNHIGSVAL
ncbi:hypothetical protein Z517_02806 [Fonsecaea pedrosoi CBS 271.37]|uniref:U6 snRNA phosphodiesterase n=1 Tax=Fonsecaea pedrosoi CBS 271.37 TaxID=1442368 RepID=A0A0D2E0L9_9EURO|nr:uncharacterized protein Z517_02806 [Fonsecaea pedrosoi CBS 271.37]KIW83561.1 hypothetical protein Z517_02806 [Fonsecaea pedrosoi CBS 271.37]